MGTTIFVQVIKKGDAFLIYVISTQDLEVKQHEILLQYQTYNNVFEKNITDMLFEHRPYDCAIEFEGAQPPFEPIYNLSQDELTML
jgi:hypothetical protein